VVQGEQPLHLVEIDVIRRRNDCSHQAVLSRKHDGLRELVARNMTTDYSFHNPDLPRHNSGSHSYPLRRIDLCDNGGYDLRKLQAGSNRFPTLNSLSCAHANFTDLDLRRLTQGRLWANLVELDLRQNVIDRDGTSGMTLVAEWDGVGMAARVIAATTIAAAIAAATATLAEISRTLPTVGFIRALPASDRRGSNPARRQQ
jgi:hypothetical protein